MIVLRPIKESDFETFYILVSQRGTGVTSLPKDKDRLYIKVMQSIDLFENPDLNNDNKTYIFVLENTKTKTLGGTCGIFAKGNWENPQFFYTVDGEKRLSPESGHTIEIPILKPVSYTNSPSELCGLYLSRRWRNRKVGKLLSLARFLFIAKFREKFTDEVIAEMRGANDKNGKYIFWEQLGRTFYDVERKEALNIQLHHREQIQNLLPQHPIYILLLPQKVRDSLYEINPKTMPALNMLSKQGFELTGEVDIIDAGPKLSAKTDEIPAIKKSQTFVIESIVPEKDEKPLHIISNDRLEFRACYGTVTNQSISQDVADALYLSIGDTARFYAFNS